MISFHLHQFIEQINDTIDRYTIFYEMFDNKDYVSKREMGNVIKLLLNHKLLLQGSIYQEIPIGLN